MFRTNQRVLLSAVLILFALALLPSESFGAQARAKGMHTVVTSDGREYQAQKASDGLESANVGSDRLVEGEGKDSDSEIEPDLAPTTPNDVIGGDGRAQVHTTTAYPYRAVAKLVIVWPNGDSDGCTGWFIGPRVVATAGHCVYTHNHGTGWAKSIKVYPGRDGSDKPYNYSNGKRFFTVKGWKNSEYKNYDYGAVQMYSALGNTVGWFGFHTDSAGDLDEKNVRITGYPGDKPFATMWTDVDKTKKVWSKRVFYRVDTQNGESGAPVYHSHGSCYPCSMAIHTYGVGGDPLDDYNSGTRITGSVFDNLVDWKNYHYP